jgi:anti-sigma B factor antagonist
VQSHRPEDGALRGSLRPRGPVQFELGEERRDGYVVLSVSGELDVLTAPRLAGTLLQMIRQEEGDMVIDLSQTRFIDSVGLHALLNAQRRLTRRGRRLAVIVRPGQVSEMIELARLVETLGAVPSWDELRRRRVA